MSITTLSSRQFNQDTSKAKKAAETGPVFITTRGRPAHVLLSIEEYQRISGRLQNIADLIATPDFTDIDLIIPPRIQKAEKVNLS